MKTTSLNGPYELEESIVNRTVPKGITGIYLLGRITSAGDEYVILLNGRAEKDLNVELKNYIGKYDVFKYSKSENLFESFKLDCSNFHKLNGSAVKLGIHHPESPEELEWKCPVCGV